MRCILATKSLEKKTSNIKTGQDNSLTDCTITADMSKNNDDRDKGKDKNKKSIVKETVVQITILLSLTFARRHHFQPFVVILLEVHLFSLVLENLHWRWIVDCEKNHRDQAEE